MPLLNPPRPDRRQILKLAALPALPVASWLAGCASPLPVGLDNESTPAARARLRECAEAHGLAAYGSLHDVNVSYAGEWRAVIGKLQPALVDPGFRQGSQERLLLGEGLIGQLHSGPDGKKQVLRQAGSSLAPQGAIQVWFNGEEARDSARRQTAALVADAYRLFLLGPLAFMADEQRLQALQLDGTDDVEGRDCDVLRLNMAPGIGLSRLDRLALYIDRKDSLLRRIRFTLDGFEGTQGAIAEVEMYDHIERFGIRWPTRFFERVKRPVALPAHDWQLTGLDINRGYGNEALTGGRFSGAAVAPAEPLKL